ncbi:hypothetical protein Pcinc_010399 [Petrolisthes cinctipes]|uniref:Uncharacterized protein n=1 Tax=Petrolisthes cinctipes TaxID=88211 RepID=A0AAE1KVF2_PETCI|nr:hypothetical protein Pcinc_010399 [Petrolisthes cinctipes]
MELAPSQGSNPEAEESITQLMALPASLVYSPHPSSAPTTSREHPRGPTVPMTLRLLLFYLSSQEEASGSFFVEARGGSIHAVGVSRKFGVVPPYARHQHHSCQPGSPSACCSTGQIHLSLPHSSSTPIPIYLPHSLLGVVGGGL